ncbi:MAG: hypothetical protein V1847_02835 [Candidatus Diapherotrites archaeon]
MTDDITEKLRQQLLDEEFKLRKKQPAAWTKIKYRKQVKLPKDFLKKSRKKKKKGSSIWRVKLSPEKGLKKKKFKKYER